jgi:hypothetical protein
MSAENKSHNAIADFLVSTLADWSGPPPKFQEALGKTIAVDSKTVGKYLRELITAGRIAKEYVPNVYKTRFCHDFRVGLRLDFYRMQQEDPEHMPGAERFIDRLIEETRRNEKISSHLVIAEGLILHGADRDVELTILTDSGIKPLYEFIRDHLSKLSFITGITTATVSYCHSRRSYAGEYRAGK